MVEQKNNPLRYIVAFYAIGVAINAVSYIHKFATGSSLTKIVANHKMGVLGFSIMLLCVISCMQKKMLAWWMAMIYFPTMFVYRRLEGHAMDREGVIVLAFSSFAVFYIASKYSAYKKYINRGYPLEVADLAGTHSLYEKKKWFDSSNPLRIVFIAAIALGVITYLNIITAKVLIDDFGSILGYSYQAIKLSILLIFSLLYLKKTILAWWIALLYGPVLWLFYFIYQPFQPSLIPALSAYAIVVCYLIVKYRSYKSYLTQRGA